MHLPKNKSQKDLDDSNTDFTLSVRSCENCRYVSHNGPSCGCSVSLHFGSEVDSTTWCRFWAILLFSLPFKYGENT